MRQMVFVAALVVTLHSLPLQVTADVDVVRLGAENPAVTIAKSTFWGGVTGLILGGAVALVVDDDQEDIIKWFLVGGVFAGFGYGVYHVATREAPTSSLLRIEEEGLALGMPSVEISREASAEKRSWRGRVTIFSQSF
jgi:hypothetical protein